MAPPQTTLIQDSKVTTLSDGSQRYEILSYLDFVKAGDLPGPALNPYREIFVHKIVVTNNPKDDLFLRVGQVPDLTTLPRSRERAININSTLYLSATCTIFYPRLDQAVAAKKLVQARLDELIAQWHLYSEEFVVPDEFELPLVSPSIVQKAKDDYFAAKADRIAADQELLDLANLITTYQVEVNRANDDLTAALQRQANCVQIQTILTSAINAEGIFRTAGVSFAAQAVVYEDANPDPTFDAQIDAFKLAIEVERLEGESVLAGLLSLIETECTAELAAVVEAGNQKTFADSTLASTKTDHEIAQRAALSAAEAEAEALAYLLEVCPDFEH